MSRVRTAMIDMLKLKPISAPEADQAAHAALLQAIADRQPQEAAELSRTHLSALKAALT